MAKKIGNGVQQVAGVPGLSLWRGEIGGEYLSALRGSRKKKIFIEMQDDAVIGTLLDSMKMPLIAAEVSVQPHEVGNEVDQEAADFLKSCMDDMTRYSWRQHELDMLDMLGWGWSVAEAVFKKRLGPVGDRPSQYSDGKIGLHILDPRGQETLKRWVMDDEFNVEAMVQEDPNEYREITIEGWKLIHSTFRSRKRSPEGTSPLRSLYRAWYTRKNLEIIEAIGAERDTAGLPVITLPQGAVKEDKEAAETIVRNIRLDEESGVVLPAPPVGAETGWKLELLSSAGSKQYNIREIIRDLNKIILMRFFAQFLMLGMEQAGTQALVEGSQDFFSLCLRSIQQELLETWQQQLVPILFKLNPWPGISGYPVIDWALPGQADVKASILNIKEMVSANVLTAGEDIEDFVRSMLNLPDRPEGVGIGPRTPLAPIGSPFFYFDWVALPNGEWLASPKKAKSQWTVSEGFQEKYLCECIECGYQMESEAHCNTLKCPECGGDMRRAERPGAGQPQSSDAEFAEVAGITGRRERGKIEKATNAYQAELLHAYDSWSTKALAAMRRADRRGDDIPAILIVLDEQLLLLADELKNIGRDGIKEAMSLGMQGKPLDPEALKILADRIAENEKYVDGSLIPDIRKKLSEFITDSEKTYALEFSALAAAMASLRARPAGYAGGFWSTVFIGAGLLRNRDDKERQQKGEQPRRVRWVLDPSSEHCEASAGRYGCADLEGEYESWDALPTLPAGNVTCLGNCRCSIEVYEDGGWTRVA